jgi:hypothetical protein
MYYKRHGWNTCIWYNEHYMSKPVSHAVSTLDLYHPSGRWLLGWYRVLGLIRHVIQILTCNIQYVAKIMQQRLCLFFLTIKVVSLQYCLFCFIYAPLVYLLSKDFWIIRLFQSFNYDRTWWRLFQKPVLCIKLDWWISFHYDTWWLAIF